MALAVATVTAVAPIVTAAARAIDRGWLPVSDNALITIRARDVFTAHHPLLGTWSSASATAGIDFNNPGPLLFDVLAPLARLVDGGAGVVATVALLNVLSIIGIVAFARRRGGDVPAIAAVAVTAGLTWAMGSEILIEPWQPHSMLLPFLCFVVLCWSVACGDLPALPLAAFVGSLIVQTHLSYGILVPAVAGCGVVGLALDARRRRSHGDAWPVRRRRISRAVAATAVLLALCWAQTILEQLVGDERGNLGRLAEGGRIPYSDMVGVRPGVRIVAAVVAEPPWWFRPSFRDTLPSGAYGGQLPSFGAAVALLAGVVLVLAGCAWVARRRRDEATQWAAIIAVVALLTGVASAIRAPASGFGIAPHHFRWVWPISAFVGLVVVMAIVRALRGRAQGVAVAGLASATVVLGVLNLPFSDQSPTMEDWAIPAVKDLHADLTGVEDRGTLLVRIEERLGDPYGSALLAELQRRGVPFVVDDPSLVRQLGPSRRYDPGDADAQLVLKVGDHTLEEPLGSRRVASIEGLDRAEQAERLALEREIEQLLVTDGLPLNREGASRLGRLYPDGGAPGGDDPRTLLDDGQLLSLFRSGFLDLDATWRRRFERYAALTERWDDQTAAVFLLPRPGS